MDIHHHPQQQRFTYQQGEHTAYLSYQVNGDILIYDHTIVPEALGGQGIGSRLVKTALDYAKQHNKSVIPTCSFVAHYIKKHPEYNFIVPIS